MNYMLQTLTLTAIFGIAGCSTRHELPAIDIDAKLKGVEQLVVRDAQQRVVRTISDQQTMRAFVASLPTWYDFDDIWGKTGTAEYSIEYVGGGRYYDRVTLTTRSYFIHEGGKAAAKLSKQQRAAIIQVLGLPVGDAKGG